MRHSIESGYLSASVDSEGAQLRSLTVGGVELLWNAVDPWEWTAPVLFPIISGLPAGELVHADERYPIVSHGFARRSEFTPVYHQSDRVSFSLTSSAQTLASYPFRFALEIAFRLHESTLTVTHTVSNAGDEPLPFLLGGHPAFRWPLPGAESAAEHSISWTSGGETMRQAVGGLRPGRIPPPAVDGRLILDRAQFAEDAMLFDDIEPRVVTYTASNAPRVTMRYDNFSRLGIWSKPHSGDFVCLEPWTGYPASADFTGDIADLPEATVLAAGESREFRYSITVEGD